MNLIESTECANHLFATAPWIVAVPFLVGFIIILICRYNNNAIKTLCMALSVGAVAYGFIHSLLIFEAFREHPELGSYVRNADWFVSSSFKLSMGVLVDHLSAVMMIVVTTVSLLVQIYTHGYMREDSGYSRFYAYLSLFTGSMLGLVVATNLFQMYFFWELVGVCSYFLIGFWWHKNTAAEAAIKAFLVNRVGDFGFLIGILLFLYATYGFWQGHPVLMFTDASGFDLTGAIRWAAEHQMLTATSLSVISILIFLGPMAKSAQIPLHVWLADAMEGPTPISALIHAATMVAAGVYLVARAYPLWLTPAGGTDSLGLAVVAWVGTITAFIAATIALTQFDIKRVLAWSTVSQLGYMFAGLGMGAYTAGVFHLFNHAFFKAMLFLCSGALIHSLHHALKYEEGMEEKLNQVSLMDRLIPPEQDMRNMGGLKEYMPVTRWCFLIGAISISGFPFFSGFFSKDEIINFALNPACHSPGNVALYGILLFTAVLTGFYMFRAYFMTFEGEYRGGETKPHAAPYVMSIPLVVLAVPSILSGFLGISLPALKNFGQGVALPNPFAQFVYFGHPHYELLTWGAVGTSFAVFLAGVGTAYLVYGSRVWKLNETFAEIKPLYNLSWCKWYFDEMYLAFVNKFALPVFRGVWSIVDTWVVDQLFVSGSAWITMSLGGLLRLTQNGRGQTYALVIFAWVAGLALVFYLYRPW